MILEDLTECKGLLLIACYVFVIVFGAIIVDLISGLRKAYVNHQIRTSKALRCTITKFIQYEGAVFIGLSIDLCLHFTNLWKLVSVIDLHDTPIIMLLIGIYLCIIEFISVRENADVKDKKRQAETNKQILNLVKAFGTEKIKAALKEYDKLQRNGEENSGDE